MSEKTAFYAQSLGDLRYRRHTHNPPLFAERRLLGGQDAFFAPGDHSVPPHGDFCGEPGHVTSGLMELFIISLDYC